MEKVVGVDLDGTVFSMGDCVHRLLLQQGYVLVNPNGEDDWEKFGMCHEEVDQWWMDNFDLVESSAYMLPYVQTGLDSLRQDGCKIVIITARNPAESITTMKQLVRWGISHDGLIFTENKIDYCVANGIPVLVDDRPDRAGKNDGSVVCLMPQWTYNKHLGSMPFVLSCVDWLQVVQEVRRIFCIGN